MTAEQLVAYFNKKIAKPIPFSVHVQKGCAAVYWAYEVEVTAVDDDCLHVTVFLRGTRDERGRWLLRNDVSRGDIQIPLRDGDCVSRLLGMAVAIRGLGEKIDNLPESDTLRDCYSDYLERAEEYRADHSRPRM
ncbi:hypothetical protein ACVIGB_000531 [Bradyrhizobium sp. USDA 4341]